MKNFYKYLIAIFSVSLMLLSSYDAMAGNKDRTGQAGASELLINPWAGSSGWGGVNIANVAGLEAMYNNVAGIAFTKQTELIFAYTDWLKGADIKLMNFGITQRVGESGVFGLSVMSMNFGEIDIRTIELPEGGIGQFSPRYMTISLAYGKAFSSAIYGGLNLKIVNESIADANAQGVAIDAGIQYVTGVKENIRFGISLRNIGPKMKYSGDGFSLSTFVPGNDNAFTTTQRGQAFEMPAQLNIGASYDFLFEQKTRFTLAGCFVSNSFKKDQFIFGGEFSFRDYVLLRAGYTYEEGINKPVTDPEKSNVNSGFSTGFTVQVPLSKGKGSVFAVDYSFRPTDHFQNIHSISARFTL